MISESLLKVLIVNTRHYFGGGDSTYAFNLASLLRDNGHRVFFFAMADDRNLADPNADIFVSRIDFREMNQKKNLVNAWQVAARSIYSSEARYNFSKLLDRVQPDLVHVQNLHGHITPSVILESKKRGLPVVWTLHDYKLICPNSHFLIDVSEEICEACIKGVFLNAMLKRCKKDSFLASTMAATEAYAHQLIGIGKKVDAYLSPSAFLMQKLREGGITGRIHHLPLFISEEFFHRSDQDEGYILFFGKLEPIKGIYQLLAACQKIQGIKVKIAGRISETEENKIRSQFGKNIDYVGVKTGDELRNLIRRCRAVAVPSIWYENQPFSILEAFASCKPVIASNIGGMRELVRDHETGILVEPGNVDELEHALVWMSEHPDDAQKMGEAAFTYARNVHAPEQHYQSLMVIYKNVLLDKGE